MRRWMIRFTILLALLLIVGGGVLYWTWRRTKQVPEFYSRAIAESPQLTQEASKRLNADLERLRADAARLGSWHAQFSDKDINAWLIEELPSKFPHLLARGARDPRVVIEDGHIMAAVRYQDRSVDTVISCRIEVALTEQPNMLAIKISGLQAGALPLPLDKFLKRISGEAAKGGIDLQWDHHEQGPVALVTVPSEDPRYVISPVTVESVELTDGLLTLSGHTGSLAESRFQPQGPIYRFVSFEFDSKTNVPRHKLDGSLR